jgi:hypothetical protein
LIPTSDCPMTSAKATSCDPSFFIRLSRLSAVKKDIAVRPRVEPASEEHVPQDSPKIVMVFSVIRVFFLRIRPTRSARGAASLRRRKVTRLVRYFATRQNAPALFWSGWVM